MASVYLAYDPATQRDVAIKILPTEMLHDPTFRARFQREAQLVARMEHSAIVPVYDYGEQDGQPYIVMRYLSGGALVTRLKDGPLSLEACVRLLNRIAPALDHAHAQGVIHRDLKPGNVLFDQVDDAYLSDFGIARLTESSHTLTGTGVIGTPAYMSPEQAGGSGVIDARSDLYSLGVIVFECLSGRTPYEAETPMGLVVQHITAPLPHIRDRRPDLPPALEPVIARALAKQPADRFPNAAALAEALAGVAAQPAIPPLSDTLVDAPTPGSVPWGYPPAGATPPVADAPRKRTSIWIFAAGGFLAVICLVAAALGALGLWVGLPSQAATATPIRPTPQATREATALPTDAPTLPAVTLPPPTPAEPTIPPSATPIFEPLRIHPYCAMEAASPVIIPPNQRIQLVWKWTALTAQQVQDHVDAAIYEIVLDGSWVASQERGDILYDGGEQVYYVEWFAQPQWLSEGEHLAERYLSWRRQIFDGWTTYGPGGEIETEHDTCTIIVR
jgi:serine/threonine-protein kinase